MCTKEELLEAVQLASSYRDAQNAYFEAKKRGKEISRTWQHMLELQRRLDVVLRRINFQMAEIDLKGKKHE